MPHTEGAASKPRLRILCVHGFNNDIESFEYLTSNFRKLVEDKAEFFFINAPVILNGEKVLVEPSFSKKGFKGPFRSWFKYIPDLNTHTIEDE